MALEIGGRVLQRRRLSRVQLLVAIACGLFFVEIVGGIYLYYSSTQGFEFVPQPVSQPMSEADVMKSLAPQPSQHPLSAAEVAKIMKTLGPVQTATRK